MLTDVQRSKLDRRFELLDTDGDGLITAADYDLAAANVCRAFDFAPGSAQYERIHTVYLRLWVSLSRKMDADESGRVTREQFVQSCADSIVQPAQGYDKIIRPVAETIIDLIDDDHSGTLDIEELTDWFNAYGVCADDAERAFRALDRNGDGVLDREEIQQALREFYTSDDPGAPGNLVFGPLEVVAASH